MLPEMIEKTADIQQKFPASNGFLTYNHDPSEFLPTISALCPGFNTATTEYTVPGPERQLSGWPLGDAIGTDDVGGTGDATAAVVAGTAVVATATEGMGEAVSVGFTLAALIDGKLQAKINIETINKTMMRRFFIAPPDCTYLFTTLA
jgi:hypothetical protein